MNQDVQVSRLSLESASRIETAVEGDYLAWKTCSLRRTKDEPDSIPLDLQNHSPHLESLTLLSSLEIPNHGLGFGKFLCTAQIEMQIGGKRNIVSTERLLRFSEIFNDGDEVRVAARILDAPSWQIFAQRTVSQFLKSSLEKFQLDLCWSMEKYWIEVHAPHSNRVITTKKSVVRRHHRNGSS